MTVKQNGKARVVMTGGNIIAQFVDGTAEADKAAADVLAALGYEVVPGDTAETEELTDGNTDAGGEAPAENAGNKRSGRGKSA